MYYILGDGLRCQGALMIRRGWDASSAIFDVKSVFMDSFVPGKSCRPEPVLAWLENPWAMIFSGMTVKKYPSCTFTHPALDGFLTGTVRAAYSRYVHVPRRDVIHDQTKCRQCRPSPIHDDGSRRTGAECRPENDGNDRGHRGDRSFQRRNWKDC